MKYQVKLFVVSIIAIIMAFSASALHPSDVYFFVVPKGYDLESLSKSLGVEAYLISKYNPQTKDGIFPGMQLFLPAAAVSKENLKKIDPAPTFAGGALKSVYEYALSGGLNQTSPQTVSAKDTTMSAKDKPMSVSSKPQQIAQTDTESSYQPVFSVSAWYVDPTWRDLKYVQMGIKIKGEHIIAYEDPFTKKYVDCKIPYRKMTSQEKSQMNYMDSQGRSYELYVGGVEYIATIGKLTVYFADLGFGQQKVYTMDEVTQKPHIFNSKDLARNKKETIEHYINSHISNDRLNPNPLGDMEVSFIVNRDGKISDIQILTTPDPSLNSGIIDIIKKLNTDSSIGIEAAKFFKHYKKEEVKGLLFIGDHGNVDCRYQLKLKVKPKMTNAQLLDECIRYWDKFFAYYKDDIEYARNN